MTLLAPALAAIFAIELLAAFLFALAFVRRSAESEYGVAALLCSAAGVHAWGSLMGTRAGQLAGALAADRAAWLGLIAVIPLTLHFGLAYRGIRPTLRWLGAPYGLAVIAAGVDLRGLFEEHSAVAPRASRLLLGAADGGHRVAPLGVFAHITLALAAAWVLTLTARAYLSGKREGLAVVIGATMFFATAIHDSAVASGALAAGYLVDAGLGAFVVGILTTPSAKYAAIARELDRRTKDLRSRTHELRRSYEDLRTAQEELVKKEQLAVVGELAAVIAHEVRNPLAIIANAVAGLRKQAISREDHETLLGILEEETSRLNRLVTDLLRYARPVNVQRSHFLLGDLLERALGFAKTKKKTINVELSRGPHEGAMWGDANLLRQVFDNLIDNAVQAMGQSGTLTVRMRSDNQQGIDGVAVDIIDTGEGMDTQVRSRARDPFFTTRPSGTGLGLAIVDRIVDAHGGEFVIDSHAGEGTTVTVFLPHGSASEPPVSRARTPKPTTNPPGPTRATG
jgi:signal transduction histidine kinase